MSVQQAIITKMSGRITRAKSKLKESELVNKVVDALETQLKSKPSKKAKSSKKIYKIAQENVKKKTEKDY